MTASRGRRWQLTAPVAALSRPIRTQHPSEGRVGGLAAAAGTPLAPAPTAGGGPGPAAAAGERVGGRPVDPTRPGAGLETGLPVLLGGARARQVDAATCGAAVLVMLAATGDPALAEWLETGRLPPGPRPPEIPGDAPAAGSDAAGRFAAAQRHVKQATARRALGPLPWPAGLGTPPWTAARQARFPGVRYRVRAVDDSAADAPTVLGLIEAANRRGQPVPLYVGGDARGGLSHAVPRHVVLAVPPPPGGAVPGTVQIYEPAAGSVYALPASELLGRTDPHPALGGWTHVVTALLPVPSPLRSDA